MSRSVSMALLRRPRLTASSLLVATTMLTAIVAVDRGLDAARQWPLVADHFGGDRGLVSAAHAEPEAALAPGAAPPKTADEPVTSIAEVTPREATARKADSRDIGVLAEVATDLQQREAAVSARERSLALREAALAQLHADLEAELGRLEAFKAEIEKAVGQAIEADESDLRQLVKVYENMKAKSAATVFDELDPAVLVELARRMREQKLAAILAQMEPARARFVTTALAQETDLPEFR